MSAPAFQTCFTYFCKRYLHQPFYVQNISIEKDAITRLLLKKICIIHHCGWWIYRILWKTHHLNFTVEAVIFKLRCPVLTVCLFSLCFQLVVVGCWLKWVVSSLVQVSLATTPATWTAPGKSPCQLDMVSSMDVRAFLKNRCHFQYICWLSCL